MHFEHKQSAQIQGFPTLAYCISSFSCIGYFFVQIIYKVIGIILNRAKKSLFCRILILGIPVQNISNDNFFCMCNSNLVQFP